MFHLRIGSRVEHALIRVGILTPPEQDAYYARCEERIQAIRYSHAHPMSTDERVAAHLDAVAPPGCVPAFARPAPEAASPSTFDEEAPLTYARSR